ncbi:hypothetical protein HY469_02890 [Candidatus Roizmanbacteria bacterium]|nr:hypothetical protein [Candidatus Roizmanbacteria bacterium]
MKKIAVLIVLMVMFLFATVTDSKPATMDNQFWDVQSIDTMKYSRDLSREKLQDPTFDAVIDQQMKHIAETGATHVAIATPYDEEFLPILKRWVAAARTYNLNVWYRGNWSGWERWFGYPSITRDEHAEKTHAFIIENPGLFIDGDIFTACPECENGGPGDPRLTADVFGHRQFLINEYELTKQAFEEIDVRVISNYISMNGDVARLVMDRETTQALDDIVVIDHYVSAPEQLVADIQEIAEKSGGHVVLGEFGAPIGDIHGSMTEEQQAAWLNETLERLAREDKVVGLNYWVNVGGSTQLWNEAGEPSKAVSVLGLYFEPRGMSGIIKDEVGNPIAQATISNNYGKATTNSRGEFSLLYVDTRAITTVDVEGYALKHIDYNTASVLVTMSPENPTFWYTFLRKINFAHRPSSDDKKLPF